MKTIYMLNNGDNIDKVKYEYKIDKDLNITENKEFGFKYVDIIEGIDDICVVNNYLPYNEYIVKKDENIMDILAKGFKIQNSRDITEGDVIIINRPKSIRYVTKPLEKLEDVARKYGITEEYIMKVNNLNSNKLFIGQILWL